MATWRNKIKLKHLFTDEKDHQHVQASMKAIADELDKAPYFNQFRSKKKFRAIPQGDDIFGPVDYANRLLDKLYDFSDAHLIWIE